MFRTFVKVELHELTEEEEEKEEQFGQIEVLYFGALSALSAGMSRLIDR